MLIHPYREQAVDYDFTKNLYYFVSLREWFYRRKAVQMLHLSPGDTVIEIGCGTGINFSLLHDMVGGKGKIIGIDSVPEMLDHAYKRVEQNQWSNVELVQKDASKYEYPNQVNGILSTFTIADIPESDWIIKKGAEALSLGKRFVILDVKIPDFWPKWPLKLYTFFSSFFKNSQSGKIEYPWQSIQRYLERIEFEELFLDGVYLCVGKKV
ncbi:methyltransferase domain-containing protein [Oscillatoria sp. CS-180]|uniref:class I SAM-dependent methyltransferase n=1 Tax=Oscillatoria sp. CS-180 TaxID=3021720 RepID=UPI00233129E2|nr:methyltransferase domain-containing protein [Oscillatoria sp. CS-180]MDB9529736.1 methyltransferase domain-containing protein [Oscillatoria sp. CS-180]